VSIKAVKWALSTKTDATNKLALVAIAESHNDKTGDCYPSQKYIADVIGLTERPTRVRLNALEAAGFISRKPRYDTRGKRTSDGYVLHLDVTEPSTDATASPVRETTGGRPVRLPAVVATGSLITEPWKPENISRATWYRRQKASETSGVRLPAVEMRLPADSQPLLNPLYRKVSTGRVVAEDNLVIEDSDSVSLSSPRRLQCNDPQGASMEAEHKPSEATEDSNVIQFKRVWTIPTLTELPWNDAFASLYSEAMALEAAA
jgi:Helix-turn-helix domain